MMKARSALTFFFVATAIAPVWADDVKVTTYYPSPYGSYQNLESSGDTYLATEDGSVGVGTKTPVTKLDVNGFIRLKDPILPVSADNVLVDQDGSGVGVWKAAPPQGNLTGAGTTNNLASWTNAALVGNSSLVEKNGNLGIQTANPQSRVSVGGDGIPNTALFGTNATFNERGITTEGRSYGLYALGGKYGAYGESPNYGVYGDQKGGGPQGLTGEGYQGVHGIGSHYGVHGNTTGANHIAVHGVNPNGYGVYSEGRAGYPLGTTLSWICASDVRLKTSIETISNPIERLKGLRGVQFRWKNTGKNDLGFIAQEVSAVAPEVVDKDPNGFYTMKQSEPTAIFVEAIKAQQKEIESLRGRIEKLKKNRMENETR